MRNIIFYKWNLPISKPSMLTSFMMFLLLILSMPTIAFSENNQPNNATELSLQAPKQKLWLGQPNEWLLVLRDNSTDNWQLQLPQSDSFIFKPGLSSTINEEGVVGVVYPIRIIAIKAGQLTLPSISLINGAKKLSTARQVITISMPELTKRMQLEVIPSSNEIYLGQTLRLKLRWTFDYPVNALKAVNINLTEMLDPRLEVLLPWDKPSDTVRNSIGLPVSGRRVIASWQNLDKNQVAIEFETVLKPKQAGLYEFSPASLIAGVMPYLANNRRKYQGSQYPAYFNNDFFDGGHEQELNRVIARAQAFTLNVKELPAGAPEHFSGIIGKPLIDVSASPLEVKQGEPVQYSLAISHGDIEGINLPLLQQQTNFTRSFNIPAKASPAIYEQGRKTLHQTIFPRRADISAIPELTVNYFDPISGLYRDMFVASVAISVTESDKFIFSEAQTSANIKIKNILKKDPQGVWAHQWGNLLQWPNESKARFGFLTNKLILLFLLLPPALVILFLLRPLWQQWQKRRAQQPVMQFKLALNKNAEPVSHLSRYFKQRIGLPLTQFNRHSMTLFLSDYAAKNKLKVMVIDSISKDISSWLNNHQQRYVFNKQQSSAANEEQYNNELINLVMRLDKCLDKPLVVIPLKADQNTQNMQSKISLKHIAVISLVFFALVFTMFSTMASSSTQTPMLLGEQPANTTLDTLQKQHQQALQLSLDNPHKGHLLHASVAEKLTDFLSVNDINKTGLLYNIGTSWYHAQRYGKAILWLRKAEELSPSDQRIKDNLKQARAKRLDQLPEYFAPLWLSKLYSIGEHFIWLIICAVSYLWFWYCLGQRLLSNSFANKRLVIAFTFMLLTGATQITQLLFTPAKSQGVITSVDVTSRKGPGLIFAPAFTTQLNQGTEFIVIRTNETWSEVQLSNGDAVWLPNRSFSLISPVT